ncbi:hypothetical protein ACT3S2_07555 [Arthrobacter sp. AOP36-A1-22]|uniref:hypothetical protein n=1 Tax=unclassified Arthrobacter TaxID=235627 RepID=UPI002656844D|nr:hypothetical protein [Micrococcaceae bacterium]MDN5905302.1 hypothetical protein [Micrococcaceae bacterium]
MTNDKASGPLADRRPDLDYTSTARRARWQDLPEEVRELLTRWVGGRLDAVDPAGGGFTHGFAAVLRGPRPLFVKAIPADDPHIAPAYAREVEVLGVLPSGAPVPSLLEHDILAGWLVFATTALDGWMPGTPWTLADARAIHNSCLLTNQVLGDASASLPATGRLELQWDTHLADLDGGRMVLESGRRPDHLPPWFIGSAGDELAGDILRAASRIDTALSGPVPLNNDLRADNVVISRAASGGFPAGTAWICDWNYLATGPGWADWAVLWPSLLDGGLSLEEVSSWELTAGAADADLDTWFSALFIYYAEAGSREPLSTSPALRSHQQLCALQLLDLLALRFGARRAV